MARAVRRTEECPICCVSRDRLRKLMPCGHRLCAQCIARLDSASIAKECSSRCPFCRQTFTIVLSPLSLAELCLYRLQNRRLEVADVRRLPPELRAQILPLITNGRLLYGKFLVELLRGSALETLRICDAHNLSSWDLQTAAPLLAAPPRVIIFNRVEGLDDTGLHALLEVSASVLEYLEVIAPAQKFNGYGLMELAAAMPRLAHLNLSECGGLLTEVLVAIVQCNASRLQTLNIGGCRRLENEGVRSVAACYNLQRLTLFGLWKISTDSMVEVISSCTKLRALDVTRCARLDGAELLCAVAGHLTSLEEFDVGSLPNIGDSEVLALVMSTVGASLRSLSISDSEITKTTLQAFQDHCPNLYRLDISWCHYITDNSMVDMITFMPRLRILNCRGSRAITNQSMFFVAQLLSNRALGFDETPQLKPHRSLTNAFPADSADCSPSCTSMASTSSGSSSGTSAVEASGDGSGHTDVNGNRDNADHNRDANFHLALEVAAFGGVSHEVAHDTGNDHNSRDGTSESCPNASGAIQVAFDGSTPSESCGTDLVLGSPAVGAPDADSASACGASDGASDVVEAAGIVSLEDSVDQLASIVGGGIRASTDHPVSCQSANGTATDSSVLAGGSATECGSLDQIRPSIAATPHRSFASSTVAARGMTNTTTGQLGGNVANRRQQLLRQTARQSLQLDAPPWRQRFVEHQSASNLPGLASSPSSPLSSSSPLSPSSPLLPFSPASEGRRRVGIMRRQSTIAEPSSPLSPGSLVSPASEGQFRAAPMRRHSTVTDFRPADGRVSAAQAEGGGSSSVVAAASSTARSSLRRAGATSVGGPRCGGGRDVQSFPAVAPTADTNMPPSCAGPDVGL